MLARVLALLVFASGCDSFFGLTGGTGPTAEFCPSQVDTVFCADFDQDLPLGAFNLIDEARPYAIYDVETTEVRSLPNAARLQIVHGETSASPDAQLTRRLTDLPPQLALELDVFLVATDAGAVKLLTFSNGDIFVSLYSDGSLVGHVGTSYLQLLDVSTLPLETWVRARVALDLATGGCELTTDGSVHESVTIASSPLISGSTVGTLTIGPHDPTQDPAVGWTVLFDNVVVR